jgi:hypothetical protein
LINGENMPILLSPRAVEALVARETLLHEWDQRTSHNKDARHLSVVGDRCMTLQEELGKWERAEGHLAEEHRSAARVQDQINGVICGAI